ncbi:MAG TPA: aminotransferase class V-fold PLP-dependent enzyme, partial [Gemmatimonadales bacterium]|nr:aminotransferase class V-fold PLP-dependent enzyme [Gemmatimonadales bacterium]
MNDFTPLARAAELARSFLDTLPARPVRESGSLADLRRALALPLADAGVPAVQVIDELARAADPGIVAMAGPRYFGFVIGGSLPVATAADWLTSAWDQNAGLYVDSPAAAIVEDVAAGWLLDLFGLPATASVGFVTGGQMANFTCLAAARHAVLGRAGWDVEERGLQDAPTVNVVVGDEAHATIFASLRFLGLGAATARRVATDAQGRMRADALREVLAKINGPTIVCTQAGNVNTGAFDPLEEIASLAHAREAWLHVDGAFGLWAAASPAHRHLTTGVAAADSWASDGHKWLNVPYDSGFAIVKDSAVHRAAMSIGAAYLVAGDAARRDALDWVPELSRRARGFPVYAALRFLGRRGVAELVERCCTLARRMAERLAAAPGVAILNDVVLNQVLVRFSDADDVTRAVIDRVQADGTCWLAGTTWHGKGAMRVSVCNWSTTAADID